VRLLLPPDASAQDVAVFRHSMGFDQPLMVRYLKYMAHVIRFDFGNSTQTMEPALKMVLGRLPATLSLGMVSLAVAAVIGIPLGILSAVKKGSLIDTFGVFISLLGQSVPIFWVSLVLILTFSVSLQLLPPAGVGSWVNYIMPVTTIALFLIAGLTRVVRTAMLDTLGKQYLRTATAKGLPPSKVIFKHALRNAAIPIVTQLGLQVRFVVGGSVITETIFAWPGLGRLMINGVFSRDYPVVEAGVFVFAIFLVLTNLVVDLLYTVLNPRISLN
jgi:peptide/nickel transport system permease protein